MDMASVFEADGLIPTEGSSPSSSTFMCSVSPTFSMCVDRRWRLGKTSKRAGSVPVCTSL